MNRVTVKSVKNLVSQNSASGRISYGDNNTIVFSNGAILTFDCGLTKDKVYRVLKHELGYETPEVGMEAQDVMDGLCQAIQLEQNPFRCSIMCSNPTLNEVN